MTYTLDDLDKTSRCVFLQLQDSAFRWPEMVLLGVMLQLTRVGQRRRFLLKYARMVASAYGCFEKRQRGVALYSGDRTLETKQSTEQGKDIRLSSSPSSGHSRFDGNHSSRRSVSRRPTRESFKQESSIDKEVAQELIVHLVGFERQVQENLKQRNNETRASVCLRRRGLHSNSVS